MTSPRPTNLFRDLSVPEALLPGILARIARAKRRAALLRLGGFGMVISFSLFSFVPAIRYAAEALYESGFFDYVSFLASGSQAFLYWRELSLSLIEAIPSLALLALLSLGTLLIWSLVRAVDNGRIAFAAQPHAAF